LWDAYSLTVQVGVAGGVAYTLKRKSKGKVVTPMRRSFRIVNDPPQEPALFRETQCSWMGCTEEVAGKIEIEIETFPLPSLSQLSVSVFLSRSSPFV
jgi:hypothetical protein